MLYLLLDFVVDDEFIGHEILKIGYSDKPFIASREKSYNTCNYGYKLVQEKEGTLEDEKGLHKKYKHLLLPGSREWFEYSDEIVEEFFPDAEPENFLEFVDSVSPITMKTLEKEYLSDIINPDYLLGTIESIYNRIHETKELVFHIWRKLLGGQSIEQVEEYIEAKIEETNSLLRVYSGALDEDKPIVVERYRFTQGMDFYHNYVVVVGEYPNYDVKFDSGRLKIEQLALEAYKKELEKKK